MPHSYLWDDAHYLSIVNILINCKVIYFEYPLWRGLHSLRNFYSEQGHTVL